MRNTRQSLVRKASAPADRKNLGDSRLLKRLAAPAFAAKSMWRNARNALDGFIYWSGKRNEVVNWLETWRVSVSGTARTMSHKHHGAGGREPHCVVLSNGMRMLFGPDTWHEMGAHLATCHHYLSHLGVEFRRGDHVIDVGAHIGLFSVFLAWGYPGLKICAYEPDSINACLLIRNRDINGISAENLAVRQEAVYSTRGNLEFSVGPTSTTGTIRQVGYQKNPLFSSQKTVLVPSVTLEDVFRAHRIESCKLLKVDCEGSEYDLFEGMTDELWIRIENMYVEVHPVAFKDQVALRELIESKGFSVRTHEYPNGCQDFFCNR